MNIVCVARVEDVECAAPDLLVLPERVHSCELQIAACRWPSAIVVGAVAEKRFIRAHLISGGRNQIDYLKVLSDGRSAGTGFAPVSLAFQRGATAVGVLICKDVQELKLLERVMRFLKSSRAQYKVVCIPADMGSQWFSSADVREFLGAYAALSNLVRKPNDSRRRNFILDPNGHFVREQRRSECINLVAA